MTNLEKLQKLRELRDPSFAIFSHIQTFKGDKGDKGDKGEKGDSIKGDKGEKGEDSHVRGPAGRDGNDGRDGKDGKTPDIEQVAKLAATKVKLPKPEKPPTIEQILSELEKKPAKKISIGDIHDLNKLIEFLKLGGFRGGGSSTGTSATVNAADELAIDSGDHTTFTILHTPKAATLLVIDENTGQIIPFSAYTNTTTSITFTTSQQVDNQDGTFTTPTFRARYTY